MASQYEHTRPALSFRPPVKLADWARKEAEHRGLRIGEFLIFLMESERRATQENRARRFRASNAMAGELGELERSAC